MFYENQWIDDDVPSSSCCHIFNLQTNIIIEEIGGGVDRRYKTKQICSLK